MSDTDDTPLSAEEERRVAVAEYVIGLGSDQERAAMARAIETDPAIGAQAQFWLQHLAPFNEDYRPETAPVGLLARIEARLFAASPARTPWYDTLAFWRTLAGAATAAAAIAIALNIVTLAPQPVPGTSQLIAALQPVDADVSFIARYDQVSGQLLISGSGAPTGAANDYELWFIEGENAPLSLGVVPLDESFAIAIGQPLQDRFAQGITLAVTLEISGGSPTGDPQGPIVAAGPVASI